MQRSLGERSLVGEVVRAAGDGKTVQVGVGVVVVVGVGVRVSGSDGGGALDGVARVASVPRAQVARRGERDRYEGRREALGGTPAGARLQRRSPSLRSTQQLMWGSLVHTRTVRMYILIITNASIC